MKIILALILILGMVAGAQAQTPSNNPWPGDCPTGTAPNSLGCFGQAAAPSLSDLFFVWQSARSPKSRAMTFQQIVTYVNNLIATAIAAIPPPVIPGVPSAVAVTVTNCGGATPNTGSVRSSGSVTVPTGVTSCTVTWATNFTAQNFCQVTDYAGGFSPGINCLLSSMTVTNPNLGGTTFSYQTNGS